MVSKAIQRKKKFEQIMFLIAKAQRQGVDIDEERFIAELCIKWGSARRTILEYIKQLASAGKIIRSMGAIFLDEERVNELLNQKLIEEEADALFKEQMEEERKVKEAEYEKNKLLRLAGDKIAKEVKE